MFDFSANGQASEARRKSVLPVVASVAIHTVAVVSVLALTLSDGFVARTPPRRVTILVAPPPPIQVARHASLRTDRTFPRLFRVPVIQSIAAPHREPALIAAPVPALQIPLAEVARPLLPPAEVAHLEAAPPPPLRTDNLAPAPGRARVPGASAIVVSRSSGFEQLAVETPPRPRAPPVSGGEFGDATMAPAVQPHHTGIAPELPVTQSVEILSKPKPVYTEEARRQRIEGQVLLEVLFAASGEVRVLGTVRGLGHGLDESAIAAANAIRFRPAERSGIAVDSTAIVHIVFQLAY